MEDKAVLTNIEDKAVEVLKGIFDPEIPVNIHELGLIYDVSVTEQKEVVVLMTLTAPNCPAAGVLPGEVEQKVGDIEEVSKAKVVLTFDPPWDMDMMSDAAKLELGLL